MKRFWITYIVGTMALLAFCFSFLVALPLCTAMVIASGLSTLWLYRRRTTLSQSRHLVSVALMASVASVVTGFILIFLMGVVDLISPDFWVTLHLAR
jgi:hypothetical protein